MTGQIRFALQDMKNSIVMYIILFLQITMSFILFSFSVVQYYEIKDYSDALSSVINTDKLYLVRDETDFNKLASLEENEKYYEKFEELYNYIYNSDNYKAYCLSDDNQYLTEDDSPEIYRSDVGKVEVDSEHGYSYKRINYISVNENAIKSFGLQCKDGRMFNSEDMNQKSKSIILGSSFSDCIKVGDSITVMNEKFTVVGILQENNFYLNPQRTSSVLYLNDYMIFPYYLDTDPEYKNSEYISAISGTCFYTDSEEYAQGIAKKSNELGLMDLEILNCNDSYNEIRNTINFKIMITISVVIIILIFAVICMISAMILLIQRQMNEFVIHYMCGAMISDIIRRLYMPIMLIVLLSCIVTLAVYQNLAVGIIIFIFGVIISSLIIAVPAVKLKGVSLGTMLKRRD